MEKVKREALPLSFLQLRLTTVCRMSCPYCYMRECSLSAVMADALVEFLLDRALGVEVVMLHGGEPLDLPLKRLEHIVGLVRSKLPKAKISAITNGLDLEKMKALRPLVDYMGISYDPCGGRQGRKRVLANVLDMVEAGFEVDVVTVVSSWVLRDFEVYIDFVGRMARSGVAVYPERYVAVGGVVGLGVSNEVYATVMKAHIEAVNGTPVGEKVLASPKVIPPPLMGEEALAGCGWGCGCCGRQMSVMPDGTVHLCSKKVSPGAAAGNVFDIEEGETLDDFFRRLKKEQGNRSMPLSCNGCKYKDVCWGGCPHQEEGLYVCRMGMVKEWEMEAPVSVSAREEVL